MDLRHLRYFVVLSEELHFGHAASRLHMSQPPLSQRIKELEAEVGMELFHRRPSGVELSDAGALLLEHARVVLEGVARAEEAMHRIRPGAGGVIRVSLPPDTSPWTIASMTATFEAAVPDVLLNVQELHTEEQLRLLQDGELDVAVVRHPVDSVGLESGPLVTSPIGVIMGADDPLASGGPVELAELSGRSLILFPRYMATMVYDEVVHTCRDAGYMPPAIIHARNRDFAHGMVMSGRGVYLQASNGTVLPPGLTWVPILREPLSWRTSALWKKSRETPQLQALVNAVTTGLLEGGNHLAG